MSPRVSGLAAEPHPQGSSAVIPSLDGLRATSILLLLTGHATMSALGPSSPALSSFPLRLLLCHADLGVRVFFIISGFLITSLLINERAEFGSVSLKLFYIRRGLRILPAFYCFIASIAVLDACGVVDVPSRLWIYVLTYTVNFNASGVWVIGHLWSLSVEEQFYLLWPLAIKFTRLRTCVAIAIAAVFVGIAIRAISVVCGLDLVKPNLRYAFPFTAEPIAMGCLLAIATDHARRLITSSPLLSGTALLVVVLPAIALLDTPDLGSLNRFMRLITDALLTFCVARFIFVPGGAIGVVLNSPPAVFIGQLSYSIYLWQQIFVNPFSDALLCRLPGSLFATFVVAWLSYQVIEAGFLGLRKRFRRQTA
jgi:peptidoglycan/LPS O-acetylase OafA/YrhL